MPKQVRCSVVLHRCAHSRVGVDGRASLDQVGKILDTGERGGTGQLSLLLTSQADAEPGVTGAQDVPARRWLPSLYAATTSGYLAKRCAELALLSADRRSRSVSASPLRSRIELLA
jgi:hypothetical protein